LFKSSDRDAAVDDPEPMASHQARGVTLGSLAGEIQGDDFPGQAKPGPARPISIVIDGTAR
jgi:hypothetical protein